MNKNQQNAAQVEKENALREQQILNCRILSLRHAQKLASIRGDGPEHTSVTAEKLIEDAKKIAGYLIDDIDALKPKSSLVITSQMPPPAAGFKPGDGA